MRLACGKQQLGADEVVCLRISDGYPDHLHLPQPAQVDRTIRMPLDRAEGIGQIQMNVEVFASVSELVACGAFQPHFFTTEAAMHAEPIAVQRKSETVTSRRSFPSFDAPEETRLRQVRPPILGAEYVTIAALIA